MNTKGKLNVTDVDITATNERWKKKISRALQTEYQLQKGKAGTGRIVCERLHLKLTGRKLPIKA